VTRLLPRVPVRRSKYGNLKAVGLLGELYDSKAERQYSLLLEHRRITGEINRWSWAPRFVLQAEPSITYRPDFVVWGKDGGVWVVDVKSPATARTKDFSLRARLWKAKYPSVPLLVAHNGVEERV
jgi:hypothetical protein